MPKYRVKPDVSTGTSEHDGVTAAVANACGIVGITDLDTISKWLDRADRRLNGPGRSLTIRNRSTRRYCKVERLE